MRAVTIWISSHRLGLIALAIWVTTTQVIACPFCSSPSQTLSEEIESMQAAVIASLVEAPKVEESNSTDPNAPLPRAKFRVDQVIRGAEHVKPGDVLEVLFFGEANKDRPYLIMGTDSPNVMWSTPLGLSTAAHKYILQLPDLPKDPKRLEFFQEYLENKDEMLARDAYDEFAKTPYEGVIALKDKMHHERLIEWIQDPAVPASRRRLYFTMLGVCGKPEDAALLEQMMLSDDRKAKAGLDALIACYLILTENEGLEKVEERFLKDPDAEYADTYAAIMAIRFHGNDTDVIEKQRLIEALRFLLERPELADLVIPDLARWKDWEVMPRMVELFKNADQKSSWVRVPVINYLRSCPLPEAKQAIEALSEIDPDAVKRAKTFFPFDAEGDGGAASKTDAEKSSQVSPPQLQPSQLAGLEPLNSEGSQLTIPAQSEPIDIQVDTITLLTESKETVEPTTETVSAAQARATNQSGETEAWMPNRLVVWGVPMLAGVALLYTYRIILGIPLFRRHN